MLHVILLAQLTLPQLEKIIKDLMSLFMIKIYFTFYEPTTGKIKYNLTLALLIKLILHINPLLHWLFLDHDVIF